MAAYDPLPITDTRSTGERRTGGFGPGPRVVFLAVLCALGAALFFATAPAAGAAPRGAAQWNGAEIQWMSYDEGRREAKRAGKPMIVQIHAPWCGFCRRLSRQYHDPDIVALSRNFVMVLVDRDDEPEVSAAYSFDGEYVPRTLVADAEGRAARRVDANRATYVHAVDGRDPMQLGRLLTEARLYFAATPSERRAWPVNWPSP